MGLLATFQFYLIFLRVEVSHEIVSIPIIKRREGGYLREFGVILLDFHEKIICFW
jgi:hypothetical protein